MQFLEPITYENICELEPGEWIWDSKIIERDIHERNLTFETIEEPIGFRQIDILNLSGFGVFNYRPFALSNVYKKDLHGSISQKTDSIDLRKQKRRPQNDI